MADDLGNLRFERISKMQKSQMIREYMPYGRVLVVDDVSSNLYVAKGLLMPYGLTVECVESGVEAIAKIKEGNEYDIIFMDHMMPEMDGVEACRIIRDMGYLKPIVALTANAMVGQSGMFITNGFDAFIPKPIDTRELNSFLNDMIRDKQTPEIIEAARAESLKRWNVKTTPLSDEVAKAVVRDAEKAVAVLEDLYDAYDGVKNIHLYTTTVHGIKSSLLNIGENELSGVAEWLEEAGRTFNNEVLKSGTPAFIDALKSLIKKYSAGNGPSVAPSAIIDISAVGLSDADLEYLRMKLDGIKEAALLFDGAAAEAHLAEMKIKAWPADVKKALDDIEVRLLHSRFKEIAGIVELITGD
jgi:CheY-like chemotaxis protein